MSGSGSSRHGRACGAGERSLRERVIDHLPLPPDAFRMLLQLRRESRHAYAVVRAVEDRGTGTRGRSRPNLFRRLRTLRSEGLVEPLEGAQACGRAEPLKLTPYGWAVLEAETERLRTLLAEVDEGRTADEGRSRVDFGRPDP